MKSILTMFVAAAVMFAAPNSFAYSAFHPALGTGNIAASTTESGIAFPAALLGTNPVVINEIDYDQVGTDNAEFIELRNNGTGPVNLDNYTIELVNGTGPAIYLTIDLPNVNLAAGDYFVICGDAANVPNCDLDVTPNSDLIQNGSPDAVGLRLSGTLVDAVSYEGSIAGYTETTGTPNTAAGSDSNAIAFIGLSRFPDGTDTNNNAADFTLRCITPGTANTSADTGCTAPSGGLPNLTINDVTASETDGVTTFTFSVTLSSPAGAGGVTFDIATADGTAQDDNPTTEDNDYVAQALTGQTIPAGSTGPYNFVVTVNGDNVGEPTETFFVNVTNVTGATVADGQGLGTIFNDDGTTAAGVTLSGRVTTATGRGIAGVRLTLVSGDGSVVATAITSSFGYYSFEDVTAGQAYTVTVRSKRYRFSDPVRVVNLDDAVSGLDFVAD